MCIREMAEVSFESMLYQNSLGSSPSDIVKLCFPSHTSSQISTVQIARPDFNILLWIPCLESPVLIVPPSPPNPKLPGPVKPMSVELLGEAFNDS